MKSKTAFRTTFFIAVRYLFSKKRHHVVNLISIISLVGVLVVSAALVVVLSVFNGMEDVVVQSFNKFNPDIAVRTREGKVFSEDSFPMAAVRALDNVAAVHEAVEDMVLLTYNGCQTLVTLKGVNPDYVQTPKFREILIDGADDLTAVLNRTAWMSVDEVNPEEEDMAEPPASPTWAVMGAGNAGIIQLNLNRLEPLKVYYPKRTKKHFANPADAFKTVPLPPVAVFSTYTEYDDRYVFAPIGFVRDLMDYEGYLSVVEIELTSPEKMETTRQQISDLLGEQFVVKDKYQQEELLFKTIKTEKLVIYLIMVFILLLAAFNIIGTIGMLVVEKKQDVVILRQLGASGTFIRRIFLLEGSLISLFGGMAGIALGCLLCFLQQTFHLIAFGGAHYVLEYYPVSVSAVDLVLVFAVVVVMGFLAALLPTRRIGREGNRETVATACSENKI